MIFKSSQPEINLPTKVPVWNWLFDSSHSPHSNNNSRSTGGYTNVVTKEYLSYEDVKTYTTYLSTALVKSFGFQPGQIIAIFSPNSVWYPVAMLGALRAGGIVSGASPAYNIEEMAYALKTAKATFLMTVPDSMEVAAASARNAGIPREHIFLLEGEMEGFTSIQKLLSIGKKFEAQIDPFRFPRNKSAKDVCGYLSFSSGTTGLPKAVMISHANVIAQCLQVLQITPPDHTKVLAALPMFHITGLIHQLHLPIILKADVYMLPAFDMQLMLEAVSQYKIKEMLVVPPILIRMVRERQTLSRYDLSHLKRFSCGAAPLSAEILQLLEKRFPGTGFKQGYGMTESCSCITAHPPENYDYRYASRVGAIVASTDLKIVDPYTGKECGYDEPGEIWARGPQIAMGYLDNEEATEETFDRDGFLHTGDIGHLDREGLLTITDRIKEMIKVKGTGVAPAELEDLLLGHPYVEDVAVLGIPDQWAGERPKAYVVLSTGLKVKKPTAAAESLIGYVKEKKERHKWIKVIEIVDEIPKSQSGKILRRVLKTLAEGKATGIVVRDSAERPKL